ncbi:MAG: hypothetical protein KL787_01810 [Taibaiella sp.]|nr:hypothetical protein [Taibaiella sp.]
METIKRHTGEYVVKYNNEPVERAVILDLKENKMTAFEQQITDFSQQLTADFKKQADFNLDKISKIQIQKVVLDKNGHILYFEPFIMPMENGEPESVIGKEVYAACLDLVDQLIQNYGKIKMDNRYAGKNIFIDYFGGIALNERVFSGRD